MGRRETKSGRGRGSPCDLIGRWRCLFTPNSFAVLIKRPALHCLEPRAVSGKWRAPRGAQTVYLFTLIQRPDWQLKYPYSSYMG
ncbi:hypothetical protein XELAEV_18004164mg [Xenopus laevis]|uniref:Uncharacterized protein n=1 Tax=Xenopus laevis TaxID=8355 RepID=A0A974BS41_XENLA|nr:hypothetical protein XELAEV_18004164mg [Xenopus laevis]